jgi:3-deoxy-D-manno-octulosonate 8-phosphate phosphatase (KDO 8-P phosphatase)
MNDRLAKIKLLLLDVDGVLTDGRIVFDANGVESKFFNVKDGHGIKMLQRAGIQVGIISGRTSQVVKNRALELAIDIVHQGASNKLTPYLQVLSETGFSDDQVAFMGDDVIDIPLLRRVGFAAAPADGLEDLSPFLHYRANNKGGWGAVRELCDLILKGRGEWESVTARYFTV